MNDNASRALVSTSGTDAQFRAFRSWIQLGLAFLLAWVATAPLAAARPEAVLIRDVTVVNTRTGMLEPGRDVVVTGERISSVQPHRRSMGNPAGYRMIDGRGKFLVPGFVDMHAHLNDRLKPNVVAPTLTAAPEDILSPDHLLPYLANGVTTLQVMHGDGGMLVLRDRVRQGAALGPRMVVGSTILDGVGRSNSFHRVVVTPDEARATVDEMKAAGYDFIKVYDQLTLDAYDAILDRARYHHMRVDGHLPRSISLEHALAGGQHITHVEVLVPYGKDRSDHSIQELAAAVNQAGVGVTPNLIVFYNVIRSVADLPELLKDPAVSFADPLTYAGWLPGRNHYQAERYRREGAEKSLRDQFEFMRRLTLGLYRAGVPLVVGTDSGTSGTVAGFSFQDELELLAGVGISPADILRMATLNAAAAMDLEREIGTVEPGKSADLVLLAANPVADIRNARRIDGVMVRGRWIPATEMRELLTESMQRFRQLDARLGSRIDRPKSSAETDERLQAAWAERRR